MERVPQFVSELREPVLLDCTDADTVICAAALKEHWTRPIGVWLEVSTGYSAQMCARDVKTLSWLVDLDNVVVSARSDARAHAEVVRALLTNDEVNFSNDVATLVGAYHRPAPAHALRMWSSANQTLRSNGLLLSLRAATHDQLGVLTSYE